MNLQALLAARVEAGKPVRVGLIGAGKFGSMFLAQVPSIKGLEVAVIADLDPERAKLAVQDRGLGCGAHRAHPLRRRRPRRDCRRACRRGDRGDRQSECRHCACARRDSRRRKHIVMVNVEADALAGPLLARKAREAGVIYSMAYGDQPALIAEMVDWARSAGFVVAAAGKGTKYLPAYHARHAGRRVGALRAHRRGSQGGRHEFADVQFVSRRHQIGDRDGGGRQCLRARCAA